MGGVLLAAGGASAADFYKGKRIRLMIGNTPGGSYDIAARLVGRNFIRHIPGNPSLIVQIKRGGTGLIAANYVNNIGPKDGTMIDPKFLADAKKRHFEVKPTSGLELQKIVADMMATPKGLLADAKKAMAYRSAYDTCQKLSGKKACRKKKKRKKKKKK